MQRYVEALSERDAFIAEMEQFISIGMSGYVPVRPPHITYTAVFLTKSGSGALDSPFPVWSPIGIRLVGRRWKTCNS